VPSTIREDVTAQRTPPAAACRESAVLEVAVAIVAAVAIPSRAERSTMFM
jgi:hypothetical protein